MTRSHSVRCWLPWVIKQLWGGKWQMALLKDNPKHIAKKGFKESCAWAWHEGARYWNPTIYGNDKILDDVSENYGPDVFTNFLKDFIKTNKDGPFLAYYPMCLTHFSKKDEPNGPNGRPETFMEMVGIMDTKVGEFVATLDEFGLIENTLILFTGDNGSPTNVTSRMEDREIQGGKAKFTDAGTHVPLIANWPGTTPAGTTCKDLIDFTDFSLRWPNSPVMTCLMSSSMAPVLHRSCWGRKGHQESGSTRSLQAKPECVLYNGSCIVTADSMT